MKTKQIFRNLLLGGLLVTTFVGFQGIKILQANSNNCKLAKTGYDWYKGFCPPGSTGITCYYTTAGIKCPLGWQNNPNYQCTWY
jgi:hypothetical protein